MDLEVKSFLEYLKVERNDSPYILVSYEEE